MSTEPRQAVEEVTIRRARPEDAQACGRICYEAFHKINIDQGFPPDLPDAGVAVGMLSMIFSHPSFWCVVAELNGRIVGSNCLDERSPVVGLGPITVEPGGQNHGVGRRLMEVVLDRSRERKCHPCACSSRRLTTARCPFTPGSALTPVSRCLSCKGPH